jgi:outer membrane protein
VRINIDVLNSQSQLYQTKRDLALARYGVLLGNLKLRQANGTLAPADLQPINATLAQAGSAAAAASPTVPSAATISPVPVPSNSIPGATPVVPQQPFNPQPPVMPVPPPPPVIVNPPTR